MIRTSSSSPGQQDRLANDGTDAIKHKRGGSTNRTMGRNRAKMNIRGLDTDGAILSHGNSSESHRHEE